MKVRKLRKLRMEMNGRPETQKCLGRSNGWCRFTGEKVQRKLVPVWAISWKKHQWRKQ